MLARSSPISVLRCAARTETVRDWERTKTEYSSRSWTRWCWIWQTLILADLWPRIFYKIIHVNIASQSTGMRACVISTQPHKTFTRSWCFQKQMRLSDRVDSYRRVEVCPDYFGPRVALHSFVTWKRTQHALKKYIQLLMGFSYRLPKIFQKQNS